MNTMLSKTEKKIRLRVAKRKKYIEEKLVPQNPIIRGFTELWCKIERMIK